jgi:hypothetical protein
MHAMDSGLTVWYNTGEQMAAAGRNLPDGAAPTWSLFAMFQKNVIVVGSNHVDVSAVSKLE